MNRITFVLFLFFCTMIVSACGQYGALYAPSEETTEQQTEDEKEK